MTEMQHPLHKVNNPCSNADQFSTRISSSTPNAEICTYDYVIIGGGTAGCVLAHRLSAKEGVTVLLLEAGWTNTYHPTTKIPSLLNKAWKSDLDWNFNTTPQPQLADRRIFWPRGKCLGGSSILNAMIYQRCLPRDWDNWAEVVKEPGWKWQEMLPFFNKSETFHAQGLLQEEWAEHGVDGPWNIERPSYVSPVSRVFIRACVESGHERIVDVSNSLRSRDLGVTHFQGFTKNGLRHDLATAYLSPVMDRPNLVVGVGCQVERIEFDLSRARRVVFRSKGHSFLVQAHKEIILSAGAVQSPQILMLSGIGPLDQLDTHQINPVKVLEGVGRNLQDHLQVPLSYFCKTPSLNMVDNLRPALIGTIWAYLRGDEQSELRSQVAEAALFYHVNSQQAMEILFAAVGWNENGMGPRPKHGDMYTVMPVLLNPKSRGRITLASADPLQAPVIDPNYLDHPDDWTVLIDSLKKAHSLAERIKAQENREKGGGEEEESGEWSWLPPTVKGKVPPEKGDWSSIIKARAETLYHPTSTCSMGLDEFAVVDAELRVHGVQGLRVVDASVFPDVPSGHPCAVVVALAERAAYLIQHVCSSKL